MAEIAYTRTPIPAQEQGTRFAHGCVLYVWAGITESDTCQALEDPGGADCSVHVEGSFGGGTIDFEGSNVRPFDTSKFITLKDLNNDDIQFSGAGIVTIRENTVFARPKTPTGTSVSLNVWLLSKAVR